MDEMIVKSAKQIKEEKWRLFGIFPVQEVKRQLTSLESKGINTYAEFVDETKLRMKIFTR